MNPGNTAEVAADEAKKHVCRFCKEEIPPTARKCSHCGKRIDFPIPPAVQPLLTHGPFVFLAVGLVIYGLARIAHDSFYSRLHLTAEEAGLNQTIIVTRAALYSIVAISISIAVIAFVVTLPILERDPALHLLALPLGVVAALFLAWTWREARDSLKVVIMSAILWVLVDLLVHWAPVQRLLGNDRNRLGVLVISFVAIVVLAFAASKKRGGDLAGDIQRGERVEPHRYELLALNAQPVCVEWIGSSPRHWPKQDVALMRLGEADRTLVLYDFRPKEQGGQRPLRVPASNVILVGADEGNTKTNWTCPS